MHYRSSLSHFHFRTDLRESFGLLLHHYYYLGIIVVLLVWGFCSIFPLLIYCDFSSSSSYKNPVFSTQKQGIELLTLLLHLKLLLHHLSVLQNLVLTLSSSHTLFQLCSNLLTFQLFIMKIIQYLAQKQVIHSIGSNKDFLMSMRVIQKWSFASTIYEVVLY
jgi:hypothetical protein